MISVWVGKLSLAAAIRSEHIEITGPRALRERLAKWFLYSPINVNSLSNSPPHAAASRGAGRAERR